MLTEMKSGCPRAVRPGAGDGLGVIHDLVGFVVLVEVVSARRMAGNVAGEEDPSLHGV